MGVNPTVVLPAAILRQEHSFLIPNTKAGISVVKNAWRQGHTESVLFGRQLPGPRLVNVERRPSWSSCSRRGDLQTHRGGQLKQECRHARPHSRLSDARSDAVWRQQILLRQSLNAIRCSILALSYPAKYSGTEKLTRRCFTADAPFLRLHRSFEPV